MSKFLALLALIPALASAETAPGPFPKQAPLRYGKVTGTISKNVLTEGGYTNAAEKVCDFEAEVPVFGPLEREKLAASVNLAVCETTANGAPQKVQLRGKVYPGEARGFAGRKTIGIELNIFAAASPHQTFLTQIGGAAGEPDAPSIALSLYGTAYERDGRPDPAETFAVELTFTETK